MITGNNCEDCPAIHHLRPDLLITTCGRRSDRSKLSGDVNEVTCEACAARFTIAEASQRLERSRGRSLDEMFYSPTAWITTGVQIRNWSDADPGPVPPAAELARDDRSVANCACDICATLRRAGR